MKPHALVSTALLAAAGLALLTAGAAAQNAFWNGANANWNTPADWNTGLVPGSGTNAYIDSGTVSLPTGVNAGPASVNVAASGTAVFIINGGTLNATTVVVANGSASASGTFMMSSGSLNLSSYLTVADMGDATATLSGGTITCSNLAVAITTTSSGTLTISGADIDATTAFVVGSSGTGSLLFSSGSLSTANTVLGFGSTGTGTMTGGTLNTQYLYLGESGGAGALTISNATVNVTESSEASVIIGYNSTGANAVSTLTMNSGTWTNSGTTIVGLSGTGIMNVNGGSVSVTTLAFDSGSASVGTGTMTGGTMTTGAMSIGTGSYSSGTFSMTGGNLIAASLDVGNWGVGTLNVGGTSLLEGSSSGSTSLITIANIAGSSGTATITGGTLDAAFTVAYSGTGSLSVSGGLITSSTYNWLGVTAAANGSLTVTGGTYDAFIFIDGYSGTGAITQHAGSVTTSVLYLGYNSAGGSGTATITGGTFSASTLTDGVSGAGTLAISGSGVVIVGGGNGTLTLGNSPGSSGVLNFSGGALDAGTVAEGSGTATVNFTATATTTSTFAPAITGTVNVSQTGAGDTILTGTSIYTGTTTVSSGVLTVNGAITSPATVATGTLNGSGSTGNVTVNSSGVLSGSLTSGTVAVNSGGRLAPGNSTPGADSMTTLTLGAGATYQAAIAAPNGGSYSGPGNHPVAGSNYSQAVLTGTGAVLTLNSTANTGSILQLDLSGTLPPGGIGILGSTYNPSSSNSSLDNYFILSLSNTSATIAGQFAQASFDGGTPVNINYSSGNLVGGANGDGSFALDGQDWVISYDGNSTTNSTDGGNAVVLTAVTPAVPARGAPVAFVALAVAGMAALSRRRIVTK